VWRLGVSLVVCGLVLGAVWGLQRAYASHFGFDRAEWAASAAALRTDPEAGYDNPREGMVDDVLAHELHPGMPRADVLAVLGPADSTDDFEWAYEAGWRSIDPRVLVITFSKQGTVQHYRVTE
jgi:hypothetical protein